MPQNYPHLTDIDSHLFALFLEQFKPAYTKIEFDVRVGQGRDPGPDYEENIRKMAIDLSQKRIDALGYYTRTIDLIEVTHTASLKSVGQLYVYPKLLRLTRPTDFTIRPVLVTFNISDDLQAAIDRLDIYPFKVTPDDRALALLAASRTRE